jgi:predicted nucleic acid-binding protein
MVIKAKVYLDTTVPSAYFDDRAPDRQQLTQQFWTARLPDFEPVVSTIVLLEVRDTPDDERRVRMESLLTGFHVLAFDEEAYNLAQEYVRRGIFPERYVSDANHVATAVVNGIGYFVSWNFRHLVKIQTRREVNLVNALRGHGPIEIAAPPEL